MTDKASENIRIGMEAIGNGLEKLGIAIGMAIILFAMITKMW